MRFRRGSPSQGQVDQAQPQAPTSSAGKRGWKPPVGVTSGVGSTSAASKRGYHPPAISAATGEVIEEVVEEIVKDVVTAVAGPAAGAAAGAVAEVVLDAVEAALVHGGGSGSVQPANVRAVAGVRAAMRASASQIQPPSGGARHRHSAPVAVASNMGASRRGYRPPGQNGPGMSLGQGPTAAASKRGWHQPGAGVGSPGLTSTDATEAKGQAASSSATAAARSMRTDNDPAATLQAARTAALTAAAAVAQAARVAGATVMEMPPIDPATSAAAASRRAAVQTQLEELARRSAAQKAAEPPPPPMLNEQIAKDAATAAERVIADAISRRRTQGLAAAGVTEEILATTRSEREAHAVAVAVAAEGAVAAADPVAVDAAVGTGEATVDEVVAEEAVAEEIGADAIEEIGSDDADLLADVFDPASANKSELVTFLQANGVHTVGRKSVGGLGVEKLRQLALEITTARQV
jgi:trimeric autotransporter adhesin